MGEWHIVTDSWVSVLPSTNSLFGQSLLMGGRTQNPETDESSWFMVALILISIFLVYKFAGSREIKPFSRYKKNKKSEGDNKP